MRQVIQQFEVDHATGESGAAVDVSELRTKYIQVAELSGSDLALEGTIDGDHWVELIASLTEGIHEVPATVALLRIATTAYLGDPVVTLAALNHRTE